MKINGEIVTKGDQLFDVVKQQYVAVTQTAGTFVRAKSGERIITITEGGYLAGVRRYYWHNPIVVDPGKDDADRMTRLKNIAKEVR